MNNLFPASFYWQLAYIVVSAIGFVILFGLIAGIFTYGQSKRKRRRSDGILDDAMEIGETLTHMLIDALIGIVKSIFAMKGGSNRGTWLNDREIITKLRSMHPDEFEECVARMFETFGYKTQLIGGSGDGGVDIEMTKDGRRHIVQCKKFITRKVRPHDVRDFYGAMGHRHIDGKGFFVTTNIFTLEAENFAEGKPMELIDGAELIQYMRQSGIFGSGSQSKEFSPSSTTAALKTEPIPSKPTAPPSQSSTCPQCGKTLVLRTNRNNSSQFWGCSGFPDCKYTRSV